jgi:hypothetical protein
VKEAARFKAAEKFSKALDRVFDKLVPAVHEAGVVIQEQFECTMVAWGAPRWSVQVGRSRPFL